MGIMRAARSKKEFFRLFDRAFPKGQGHGLQQQLFDDEDDNG